MSNTNSNSPTDAESPLRGTLALSQLLKAAGWLRTGARDDQAYSRNGQRYLTWRKPGVMVASSGNSRFVDSKSRGVHIGYGDGFETTIEAISVSIGDRGRQLAQSALREWAALADATEVTLFIEPVPQEDGIDRERLIKLYASYGFSPTDESARVMVRTPAPASVRRKVSVSGVDIHAVRFPNPYPHWQLFLDDGRMLDAVEAGITVHTVEKIEASLNFLLTSRAGGDADKLRALLELKAA